MSSDPTSPDPTSPVPTHEQGGARAYPLDAIRADGWFEELGAGSPSFSQLCSIVGASFVGFSAIAGIHISALEIDGRDADRSMIEFSMEGAEAPMRLTLGDFRRRLVAALLAEPDPAAPADALADPPSDDALRGVFGARTLLLAPLLHIELLTLQREPEGPWRVACRIDGAASFLEIHDLHAVLRARIQLELDRRKTSFSIDLAIVPDAERALGQGAYDEVITLLGAWPGPLSTFVRSAEAQSMPDEARSTIARALGLLGTAQAKLGRLEWAEDVLRLGIQWAAAGSATSELFYRLGEVLFESGRAGGAIGPLRRSLALSDAHLEDAHARAASEATLRLLARAFAERSRFVAALACVERARTLGGSEGSDGSLDEVRAKAIAALGEPWERVQRALAR